jgi:hypothetical protein
MGATYPRVTTILSAVGLGPDFTLVRPDVVELARDRGSRLHALLEAEHYGYLDEADVTPELAPRLDAYRKFVADSGHEPVLTEFEVRHAAWKFIGHPDRLGWINGHRCIIDFKSGGTDGAEYQIALYVLAYNHEHPDEPVSVGAILELRDDATYRFTEVDLAAATQVALAAIVVYRAQPGRRAA